MGSRLPDSIGSINWTFRLARASALLESSSGVPRKPNSVPPLTWRAIIHLGPTLPSASCDLPGDGFGPPPGASAESRTGNLLLASLFGLAPHGVYRASNRHRPSGALLPHPFTLTAPSEPGGLLSVALSVASPRLAVSEHAARRSSDFPPLELPCGSEERSPGALRRWTYSTVR